MEPANLEKLANLFGTTAQVSFGIAGLLFVALTIDEQRKKRWFDSKNVAFAAMSFLMIVFPGFISLWGLIPDMPQISTPLFAIFLYGVATISWWFRKNTSIKETRAERSKWKWLQRVSDIKGDSITVIIVWVYSLIAPSDYIPTVIGIALVASVIFSTISIFSLFRNS